MRKKTVLQRLVDLAMMALMLFLSVFVQMVSGVVMPRHVLPFLNIPLFTSAARLNHLSCGYWSFLSSLHLGFHWRVVLALGGKLRSGRGLPPAGRIALRTVAAITVVFGMVCFVRQNIMDYLFLRTEFVFSITKNHLLSC